jgi:hypothetical protein
MRDNRDVVYYSVSGGSKLASCASPNKKGKDLMPDPSPTLGRGPIYVCVIAKRLQLELENVWQLQLRSSEAQWARVVFRLCGKVVWAVFIQAFTAC